MDSYPCEPASVTLDIDDTCDVVQWHAKSVANVLERA
jgi:hypothetical protein